MASVVDYCNVALSHLGDTASVSSIDPPEGSAQAEHCARFYPIARDALLEMHDWGFNTRTKALALLAETPAFWEYAYALPSNCLKVIAVLDPEAGKDSDPQPYVIEQSDSGAKILLTNQANAVIRYGCTVIDSSLFSPLFGVGISWMLASLLAGPILKGEAGQTESKRCLQQLSIVLSQAQVINANQSKRDDASTPPWITGRS